MKQLHGGHNVWVDLDRNRASFNLPEPEAVSPSAAPKFMRELIAKRKPRFIIEVGVFLGFTSITMAQALEELYGSSDAEPFVLSIDTWLGDAYMWALRDKNRCGQCSLS